MESRIRLLGHSLHQSFVFVPLGFLTAAVASDVAYLISRDPSWGLMAFRLMGIGIITALVAAIVGFLDWQRIPAGTRAKQVGRVHGIGNVIVVLLFAESWMMRRDVTGHTPSTLALVCSIAGFGLAGVTGWLGGELVSRLGVGVSDNANLNAPSSLTTDAHPGNATRNAAA
jgi:uncharacterized membrane protein